MTGVWRLFGMLSSTEQVGQELIASVFKCCSFMRSTDAEAEALNEIVCVPSFGKCQNVYETDVSFSRVYMKK